MRTRTLSQATTLVMTPQRPTSTAATVEYSTQVDPDQEPPQSNDYMLQNTNLQNTNNFYIPPFHIPQIGISMIYTIKHFTQDYWKMDIMHI